MPSKIIRLHQRKPLTIGQIFNSWKVIEAPIYKVYFGHSRQYVMCECVCGKKQEIPASPLKRGRTKSCGCQTKKLEQHLSWKGCGAISGRYFGNIKNKAQERNLLFNITIEDVWNLFLKQEKKCALSGVSLNFASCARKADGTASLDRIDSSQGYTLDNIQWIHKDLQTMKMDFPQSTFLNWVDMIHKHQKPV